MGEQGSVHLPDPMQSWLPQPRMRFDQFVDHLCRVLLGRGSTDRLLTAACQATGCRRARSSTPTTRWCSWLMPRLLTAILDTPDHMTR